MTAPEILVIFLSVALAIFLTLAIILIVCLIIVAKKIKNVAESAERTAKNFEGIASMLQKAAAPAMVSRFIIEQINRFTERHNKSKEDK